MNRIQVFMIIFLGVFMSGASIFPAHHTTRYQDEFKFLDQLPLMYPAYENYIEREAQLNPFPELEYKAGEKTTSVLDGMGMVYVPVGGFPMGSNDGSADEQPVHWVYLDAFWIDQHEVTNAQYNLCVNDGVCALPTDPVPLRNSELADHPVVYVDWEDAKTYCEWAGRRLPTEAEWEKAARGTDGRTYPWGDEGDCSRANFFDCPEFEATSPVGFYGEFGVSPYGAYDMAGNVWEWVNDWYGADYYQESPHRNPSGPRSGIYHVWRGGSWNCNQTSARSAGRGNFNPDYWRDLIGFRCALDSSGS